MPDAISARPRSVSAAVQLLYISLLLRLIFLPWRLTTSIYPTRSKPGFVGNLLIFACLAVLFAMIWKGRKRARKILFVLVFFGGSFATWEYIRLFPLDPLACTLGFIHLGFMVAAVILLSQKSSSDWFDQKGRYPLQS